MARKKKNEVAIYACIQPCTIYIGDDLQGNAIHKLYRTAGEVELSEKQLKEGGIGNSDCYIEVEKGTIMPHHFAPENDVAEDDREDQITNPAKYIKDDCDMRLIAELMVDEGLFRDKTKLDEKGRSVIDKIAVTVACDSIKEQLSSDAIDAIENGEDGSYRKQLNHLLTLGDDDKATKGKLIKILKDAGIKMFWGAETRALAERILEEGLLGEDEGE